ncbi:hypothetical protein MMC06_001884 [Schaereria dolodes]|nr:hypothetical protein [Schaereria dolodes]
MTWLDIDWANVTDRGAASPTSAKSASSATETILIAVATNILTPEQCTMPTWNRAMTLGISLGVPLGILVLGFLGFLFWKERRFRKTDRPPRPMTEVSEVAAGSPLPPSFKSQENFKSQETFKIQENFKSQERFKI